MNSTCYSLPSFIAPILKSLVIPVIWLGLIGAIYLRIAPFCFKSHLFPSQSNCRKMKDKEYHVANFATFVSKTLIFPPQKWMNLISNRLSTASTKYFNWPSPVFRRFQNGCNKVVIEPRVVQFWSDFYTCDFKSNSRCALVRFWSHRYNFSLIIYMKKLLSSDWLR